MGLTFNNISKELELNNIVYQKISNPILDDFCFPLLQKSVGTISSFIQMVEKISHEQNLQVSI
jgi:hypothetical protein